MKQARNLRNRPLFALTFAGAAASVPASGAVFSYKLDTPLTIGGLETIEAQSVAEWILFNPETGTTDSFRGDPTSEAFLDGRVIGLQTSTIVPAENVKPQAAVVDYNTRFVTLADFDGTISEAEIFLERLAVGSTIGPDSNWGFYKPVRGTPNAAGIGGFLSSEGDPALDSRLWSTDSRGFIGFSIDALELTGYIDGENLTPSDSWADPSIPEYEQIPQFKEGALPLYGWADIGFSESGLTLYGFGYDDAGNAINVSPVPEPGGLLAVASLLGGSALLRSRRRAPAALSNA